MLLKDKKGYAISIIKKMKGMDDFYDMKDSNESRMEKMHSDEVEQKDSFKSAQDMAISDLMESLKSDNKEKFKTALKSFINMQMDDENHE